MTARNSSVDIVCFDCDSTLSRVEGIDALARRAGVEREVAPLTASAMAGELALDAAYGKRMDLVRPDRASLEWLAKLYIDEMVLGAPDAIESLYRAGKDVHIVSGGLRQAILPLAASLGIPANHVHAVNVIFDSDGGYVGFDQASPLAHPGGKAEVCRTLSSAGQSLALVGDGATDIEARAAGALIVGFGGVVVRDNVRAAADIFVAGPSLTDVVAPILAQSC